jgi:hypothetical protein
VSLGPAGDYRMAAPVGVRVRAMTAMRSAYGPGEGTEKDPKTTYLGIRTARHSIAGNPRPGKPDLLAMITSEFSALSRQLTQSEFRASTVYQSETIYRIASV